MCFKFNCCHWQWLGSLFVDWGKRVFHIAFDYAMPVIECVCSCVRVWNTSINTLISQYKQTHVHTIRSLTRKKLKCVAIFSQSFDSKHLSKSSFHWTLNTYKANDTVESSIIRLCSFYALPPSPSLSRSMSVCVCCCQSLNVIWFFWVNHTFLLNE